MSAPANRTKTVTACLLIIGNEVLSGRTQDANLKFLATGLNEIGVRLAEARVIPDVEATIVATLNECRARFDYVFTTGGIGPTHDDITSASVAKAFGLKLHRHPEAERRLLNHYRPEDVNEQRMKMADMPVGASLIDNPVSVAPGFQIENVFVMAGIPRIMQAMFEGVKHRLSGGAPVVSRTVACHTPEGTLAADLGAIQQDFPDLDIGSYPFFRHGRLGVALVLRGTDVKRLDAAAERVAAMIRAKGDTPVEDRGGDDPSKD